MGTSGFAEWVRRFEDERERRRAQGDPDWERGATLHPAVWSGVQRFQAGEDGDGVSLVAKADRAGDPDYARAVRLFVAEERNHARLLAAADHGPALHRLGPGRRRFVADVMTSSRTVVSAVLNPRTAARPDTQSGTRPGTRSGTA